MNSPQGPMHHQQQQQQTPPPPQSPYTQPPPQQQARVKVVAGYALQQKLGSGSFAIVYKGVRVQPLGNIQDFAAIKAIARNSEKLTKKVIQNLEMEISILRTYRHRNIVCMHDVQKTVNHFYLVLEYCSGGDVQGLIRSRKDRRLSEGLTRRLMRDLAHGLSFLWKQQLIHRDIKPQNLLLTGPLPLDEVNDPEITPDAEERRRIANFPSYDFCLKIADFGFARHLQSTSLAETLCGSPLYMAPEILQHHRYDAKADLWSVGTVLFEMISGEPPFHGENHIDLLRNIQRKAVRLPKDVRVSKECVNLLRVLLNRNPLARAGFKEFFEACDALVALGCHGNTSVDEGTCKRPSVDLGTIPEYQEDAAISTVTPTAAAGTASSVPSQLSDSVMTATTNSTIPQTPQQPQPQQNIPHVAAPNLNTVSAASIAVTAKPRNTSVFNPLGMYTTPTVATNTATTTMTELTTIHSSSGQRMPQRIEMPSRQKDVTPVLQSSTDENSFVMVEHGSSSLHKSSSPVVYEPSNAAPTSKTTTAMVSHYNESVRMKDGRQHHHHLEQSPPTSTGFFMSRITTLPSRASDYSIVRGAKGMLSTSPGTGGALMNMLTGRPNLLTRGGAGVAGLAVSAETEKQLEEQFKAAAKMLATAEDIGRRAISVAHLGDKRAYCAMRLLYMSESNTSSILSITPMEGIEEESSGDHDDSGGNVTDVDDDDSSSTEVMASTTRRRISNTSNADKSMPDVKTEINDDDDEEEMPFAVQSESLVSPFLAANMPTRGGSSFNNGNDSIMNRRLPSKPSPIVIRSHFNEALTCYLKALKMIKGALSVTEDVSKEVATLERKRLSSEQQSYVGQLKKQSEVTSNWLSNQFQGVLERGNATNTEITKLPQSLASDGVEESSMSSKQNIVVTSVEELLYTHSLGYGREGAVKQLLGHFEAARACYRSAGLLAETLLMEPHVEGEDRRTLEAYVDGFAAQITELDELLISQQQQQSQSRGFAIGGGSGSMATSSRRNSQSSMLPGK